MRLRVFDAEKSSSRQWSMSARARVGLELVDSVLRYAAVEETDDVIRLLRLGRCEFDFDAAQRLLADEQGSNVTALAEAVENVLDGIDAVHFHVVVHPPACTTFTAPVAGGTSPAERNEQLHWEAGQLMGLDEESFKIVVHPLLSEDREQTGPVDWFYVAALRRDVYANLVALLEESRGRVVPHFTGSVHAASSVVHAMEPVGAGPPAEESVLRLLVGQYGAHTEYTLCQPRRTFASAYWEGSDAGDAAYAAAQLVDRVDRSLTEIDELLLYGPDPDEQVLSDLTTLTGCSAERFNPFEALNVDTGQVEDDFSYWEYVPSVGVTI